MGRARSFLVTAGTAAATTACILVPAGAHGSFAAPHPLTGECAAVTSPIPGASTVCVAIDTITTAVTLPPAGTTPTLPPTPTLPAAPLPVPTLPVPVPTLPSGGGTGTPGLPTVPSVPLTPSALPVPVPPAGLPLPALPAGGLPTVADVNVAPQICGIGAGAVTSSGSGDCGSASTGHPASGPSIIGANVSPQICGIGAGAVMSNGTGDCGSATTGRQASGPSIIGVDVSPQVCGVGVGAVVGSGAGTCPTGDAASTDTSTPTNNSVPSGSNGGGTPSNNSVPTNSSVVSNVPTNSSVVANLAEAPSAAGTSGRTAGSGSGSLPVTGLSITAVVLLGGALLHWGVIAKLIAHRKVRRTIA